MTPSPQADLRFGLLLTPTWLAAPVVRELGGREFTALEGLVALQWVKSGVVGLAVVLLAYLTRDVVTLTEPVLLVYSVLLLWLPAYMLFLVICQGALERSAQPQAPVLSHTGVLRTLRLAPLLALVMAFVAGALIGA